MDSPDNFPSFEQWLDEREQREKRGLWLGILLVTSALLAVGAVVAAFVLWDRGSDGQIQADGQGLPVEQAPGDVPDGSAEASPTPTSTPTPTPPSPTTTPTPTPVPPTPTPTPTPVPPTPPPTATPEPTQPAVAEPEVTPPQEAAPQTTSSPADAVATWYALVESGQFDAAYALWTERMKQAFPRQGNLDERWGDTADVTIHALSVVQQSEDRAVVAIEFTETKESNTTRRFAGSWQLVLTDGTWLLDRPQF